MEWAKAKTAAAYDVATETATQLYNTSAKEGINALVGSEPISGTTVSDAIGQPTSYSTSLINTEPFKSFKPDPSTLWKAYLVYLLLGAGCVLPWYSFIIAADYFQLLYPNTHIIRWFSVAYLASWVLTYGLLSKFGSEHSSFYRITTGLGVSIIPLLLIPLLDGFFIPEKHGTSITFWVTLAAVAIGGSADAIAHGSLIETTSELTHRYAQAYISGTAVAGMAVFILRVVTKLIFYSSSDSLRIGGIIYFSVAAVFSGLIIAMIVYVHEMPAMSYYLSLGLGSLETVRLLVQDEDTVTPEVAAGAAIAAVAAGRLCAATQVDFAPSFRRVILLMVSVGLVSLVTLSVYPGFLTEDIQSAYLGSWYPVLLLGIYITFDLFGKSATAYFRPAMESGLFGASMSRLVIVVFFLVVVLVPLSIQTLLAFILTAILGGSNGYLTASLIILIPKTVPSQDREAAGIVTVTLLISGCLIGVAISWLWVAGFDVGLL